MEIAAGKNMTDDVEALHRLVATSPLEAAIQARQLVTGVADQRVGGILVDAGIALNDLALVEEGKQLIELAYATRGRQMPGLGYLLGTAYGALAQVQFDRTAAWAESTREERLKARTLLFEAANSTSVDEHTRLRAWVNLGNDLHRSARNAEAYEAYAAAVVLKPGYSTASGWMASILNHEIKQGGSSELEPLSHFHAFTAQQDLDRVRRDVSEEVANQFAAMPTSRAIEHVSTHNLGRRDRSYQAFIKDNRLFLNFATDGVPVEEWDRHHIPVLFDPDGRVPPVVGMANDLKADFRAARWVAYKAFTIGSRDADLYLDTKDGARYGDEPAMLRLSLRAAIDCLDRVATATNSYLAIGVKPTETTFKSLWRIKGELRPALANEYDHNNWAAVGLVDLADDMGPEGWRRSISDARNAATHRFLRTSLVATSEDLRGDVAYLTFEELGLLSIASLHVARVALLAFFSLVGQVELRRARAEGRGILWRPNQAAAESDPSRIEGS